ncbi:uncharacterized protein LOC128214887 [Mya arenaria]|uniref:uncharacterized protein LOC128214887 n=1 Tax=Mya arenaria TaxID=6604 RepID=UPI0022E579BC|nr:uncharacterized protein LOC128214887 [Mya arenaria]
MSEFTDDFTASTRSKSFLVVTGARYHSNVLGNKTDDENSVVAIEDRFQSYDEVRQEILKDIKTCNYMIAIDYTLSNISQGQHTNDGKSLHDLTGVNPYQRVILALGETLEPFKEDADEILIVGFGDKKVKDKGTFRLSQERCETFYEVYEAYNKVTKQIQLAGPTNFAPVIYEAINIVKRTLKYHILIIVADGQVVEEKLTHEAIIDASNYPLSIVVIGVGDGPWGLMESWDDVIRGRKFDNLQFVNFQKVTSESKIPDVALALAALMEIPDQYRQIKDNLLVNSLDKMYVTFIRPLLEYADVVWDNCSNELKNDIEAVQHEAARIVTGATKLCSIERLIADVNWDTLAERRRKHRLILFFKMKNGLSPEYLTNLIPQPRAQPYALRNRSEVPVIP